MGILAPRASSLLDNPRAWTGLDVGTRQTRSGEEVSPDGAMSIATYFACVAGIAEDIAGLPASVIAAGDGYRRPDRKHPVTRLLADAPNDEMVAFTFIETMQAWCDGWGNAYAEIQRDGAGRPIALWPIHPSRVTVKRDEASGKVYYWVRASDLVATLKWVRMETEDVFHVHGLGDGLEGRSPLSYRAESLGLAQAAQGVAASMFKNDLMQPLTFTPLAAMDAKQVGDLLALLKEQYAGVKKAGGILGTNVAGKFERITINPDEAQALDSRKFSVPEICRWFRRSPSKVGYTEQAKGWATREDEQTDDVQQCLLPRVLRWEAEIRRKLLGFDSGLGFKFYFQGLLRASSEKRAAMYQQRLQSGSITPNEIRALEDEAPADDPNADELLVNSTLVLLSGLGAEPPSDPSPLPPPPDRPMPEDPEDDPAPDAPVDPPAEDPDATAARVVGPVARDAAARVVGKEAAAVARAFGKSSGVGPDWATSFYEKQRGYVAEAFAATAEAYAAVTGRDAARCRGAVATLAGSLWPDPMARTAEVYRVHEDTLSAGLAASVLSALAATKE